LVEGVQADSMNTNDFVSYLVLFFVVILLVMPLFTGVAGGGRDHYGHRIPEYSQDNPGEAPMYYFLALFQLAVVVLILWGFFGEHKTTEPGRPKPVFINDLTD
jgi:amino acid transporter